MSFCVSKELGYINNFDPNKQDIKNGNFWLGSKLLRIKLKETK